jgi:hypothetical protein
MRNLTLALALLAAGCAGAPQPDCQTLAMTPPEVLAESPEARRAILEADDCGSGGREFEVYRVGNRYKVRRL